MDQQTEPAACSCTAHGLGIVLTFIKVCRRRRRRKTRKSLRGHEERKRKVEEKANWQRSQVPAHLAFYGKSLLTSDLGELLIPDCTLKPLGRTFNTFESLDPRMPEVGSIDVKAPRTHPFLPGY